MIPSRLSPGCWLFLIACAGLTGCQTTDTAGTGQMASVMITGHPRNEVQAATATAFLNNGFSQKDELTFEKKGTSWDTANYGGWSNESVWIKVRAGIYFVETNQFKLGCNAYAVEGHGELGTEEEHKFFFAWKTECKKILDEAKASLETPPAASGANRP